MSRKVPPPIAAPAARVLPFGWYGGKFSHLDWLLPLLPAARQYCEPFAGSGAVLLNRPPAPVETYNDLDGEVVNFFRVLRDDGEELARGLALTPFSREEFLAACRLDPALDPFERARRFYVRARQVRTGLAQVATPGRWANCKDTSRSGMSGVVSRWLNGLDALGPIAARLLRVQIENRPALDCLALYDSPETLFYCDPPYVHATRGDSSGYAHEMTDAQHEALLAALLSVKGRVALSGYACPLIDNALIPPRWTRLDAPPRTNHATKGTRTESLWVNYELPESRCGISEKP